MSLRRVQLNVARRRRHRFPREAMGPRHFLQDIIARVRRGESIDGVTFTFSSKYWRFVKQ